MTIEDLAQLGELIDSRLRPIDKRLETLEANMVTKSDLEMNNRVLGTIIKVELASGKQETLAVVKKGFEDVVRQVKQKLDETEAEYEPRISHIENHLGLDNPTKKN